MVYHVSQLVSLPQASPNPTYKIQMSLCVTKNRVQPHALLHTCFIYKNGDAILDTGLASWKEDRIVIPFLVDHDHHKISDISMVLVSPSCGEWTVPTVTLTDGDGTASEYVATNVDGNCMYVVPEAPRPEKIQEGMREYADIKKDIFKWQTVFVSSFALAIHTANPSDVYTKWFVMGGVVGIMYQILMQMEVDQIGNESKSLLYRVLANTAFRLSLISSAFVIITTDTGALDTSTFATILAGFMTNKMAMYATYWTQKTESSLKE